jgi:two-component system, cell cycle sensor histidine kinase and response regulator CckA
MSTGSSADLALQAEVRQLRERVAELEAEHQAAQRQAEELSRRLLAAVQEEKDRLSAVLTSISDEVWFADAQKGLVLLNPAVAREFHLDAADRPDIEKVAASLEVFRPDGSPRPVEEAPLLRSLDGEVIKGQEEIIRTPGAGELRHREVSGAPVRDASGNIVGSVCVVRDITDRKRAEEDTRRSQKTFSELVERSPFGIYIVDSQFRIAHMNASSQAGAFRNVRPVIGRDLAETMRILWPEPVAAEIIAHFRHTLETGEPYYSPGFFNPRQDVETVEGYEWELHRMTLPDGQHGVICYYFDSTKLRQAEAAVQESEERLRFALESCQIGAWDIDLVDHTAYRSLEHCRIFGYGEMLQQWTLADFLKHALPEYRAEIEAMVRKATAERRGWTNECRIRRADGEIRWIWFTGRHRTDSSGRPRVVGVVQDITERKQAEEKLFETNQRLEALMDALPIGVSFSDDPTCQRITGNPAVLAQFEVGPEENLSASAPDPAAPGRKIRLFHQGREISAAELPLQQAARYGRAVPPIELEIHLPSGRTWFAECSAAPVLDRHGSVAGGVAVTVDITERKRSEDRLRQAQKLESLGLLAGGVAHDFNNLLVGVIGNASLAQEMLPPNHPATELMGTVVKTGEQAAHLTRQMLAYSGKGKFLVETLAISELVHGIIDLARPSIPKKVSLSLELGEDLPAIEADRGQVQQILMNLAINAAEAIGSHAGLITVRTGTQAVDENYVRQHPEAAELQPGKYVVLEVRDTGCGMDGAVKAKIFDPFFSTKFTGRGLGLAAVAGIVRGHKGAIVVTSAPGKGSVFSVLFPPAPHDAGQQPEAVPGAGARGSGVVLVIDDEEVVRETARRSLERHGYTVLVADDGPAAIDILKRRPVKLDLAVLDLSMPGMSGEETLPELRKIRPEMKVLVSSGYSEAEAMSLFRGQRVSGFVQKPYTSATLAEKVKSALE